jgi:hypothetical protein
MNFGKSSIRDHCPYTRSTGAFTTTKCLAAFIAAGAGSADWIKFSDREASILIPRKSPTPSVREVKLRHIEHEHRIVPSHASAEDPTQSLAEVLLFGFHDFVSIRIGYSQERDHEAVAGFFAPAAEGPRGAESRDDSF